MAKVIEFYVPLRYQSKVKYVPLALRGKVIPFVLPRKKAA